MRGDDRGQAAPLLVAVIAVVVLALVALGRSGAAAADAARARTAADAAALAAVTGGEPAARRLAVANGATLVSFKMAADGVVARACVRSRCASARAVWTERAEP
jgi:hypothetical protein